MSNAAGDSVECDGCSNVILRADSMRMPKIYEFTLPAGENTYKSYQFRLCVECERRIVEEILDEDLSAPRVDATDIWAFIQEFRRQAERFESMADDLEEVLESHDGAREW